jgi:hypothetical protein
LQLLQLLQPEAVAAVATKGAEDYRLLVIPVVAVAVAAPGSDRRVRSEQRLNSAKASGALADLLPNLLPNLLLYTCISASSCARSPAGEARGALILLPNLLPNLLLHTCILASSAARSPARERRSASNSSPTAAAFCTDHSSVCTRIRQHNYYLIYYCITSSSSPTAAAFCTDHSSVCTRTCQHNYYRIYYCIAVS